ncbi:MAG: SPOR domain-containing protein [Paracoccus sp. (in: a-proteobacteria)]|nr:SPOR domain-containing protein [Paracoccus sp. (in: a-proteobacteria)]
MAVTDFGSGRFGQSAPRQARQYPYQHQAQDDYDEEYGWYDDDDQPDASDVPEALGARFGRVMNYVGMLASVMLLLGLLIWGYDLVARDVSGVPVIRAVQGEARTAPDDPGGELARNGGLSVNEVAAGVAVPPSAEIAIAPAPTGLEEDDIAMGALADVSAMTGALPERLPVTPDQPVVAVSDADIAAGLAPGVVTDLASLDILPVDEAAASALIAEEMTEPVAAAEIAAPIVAASRPAPRPASISARAASAAPAPARQAEAPAQATPEPAPAARADVASGAPLVQIGAFDSDALANGEWGRISNRFSSLFAGKSPVVQTTQRNGRTFYRLRVAGFDSRDDARRFCAALIAEGTDCYPATAQ